VEFEWLFLFSGWLNCPVVHTLFRILCVLESGTGTDTQTGMDPE